MTKQSKLSKLSELPRLSTPRRTRDERGMTTAEYAVGTVASCGFAGVLVKLLTEPWVQDLLKNLFESTIGRYF
jgi:hypothetical protein